MKKNLLLLITLIIYFFLGCGYTTRSLVSSRYKTIYVGHFLNKIDITKETESIRRYKIYRPLIEQDIRRAVIERFNLDGNLKTETEDNANVILRGAVLDFRRDPLRYINNDEVEEYRISITAQIELEDKDKNLIIKKTNIIGDATYFLSGPHAKAEPLAIEEAIKDIARRIVEYVVGMW
ncbi:MAG: LPS assembly lipoprotein LptE [Candidatus Omnitrophica bacterium]|nr:LPS assembly lipoprotein LptE [Candidatus Omnitrophota bacterium]